MAESPTAKTLKECKRRGWIPTVVERHVFHARKKFDAFGFGDVLVMDDEPGSLLIQATSGSNGASRVTKILGERRDMAKAWLERGNRIEVWAWRKLAKKPGHGNRIWFPKISEVTLTDFELQPKPGDKR